MAEGQPGLHGGLRVIGARNFRFQLPASGIRYPGIRPIPVGRGSAEPDLVAPARMFPRLPPAEPLSSKALLGNIPARRHVGISSLPTR